MHTLQTGILDKVVVILPLIKFLSLFKSILSLRFNKKGTRISQSQLDQCRVLRQNFALHDKKNGNDNPTNDFVIYCGNNKYIIHKFNPMPD